MLSVGIIGSGLIGQKRASNLTGAKLVAVADLVPERARTLAQATHAEAMGSWEELVKRKDIEAIIVSTTHEALTPCAIRALENGKHVLIEKPAGRNPEDLRQLIKAAEHAKKIIRVGFNHRFHPGFQKAKELMTAGAIGPLMYIRARYGHGGRLGYEKEWRADPKLSGGGELLDQGIHLIDLCRWLGGEWLLPWGKAKTFFWPMTVEDNGFLYLESPDRARSAFLHASCTEWKNLFDFEIFGKTGKLQIAGLGRSYGSEELRYYRMKPEMGPPELKTFSFPGEDTSWSVEFQAFLKEIAGQKTSLGTLEDALGALTIVSSAYDQSAVTFRLSAMQCVILAGGLGTRMQNIAKGLPKSLIPIGEHPFLYYQLTWLGQQGITDVVLCVGYRADAIERYAKDGRSWGLKISYVSEGQSLRGTGGALRNAFDHGNLDPEFFVQYGDSFLPIHYSPIWATFQENVTPALMVVMKNEGRWDKSNASFDGQRVTRYDKKKADPGMLYIDYGLSILKAETIEKHVPQLGVYDLAELFRALSEKNALAGYETRTRFYEIGSAQGLQDLKDYIKASPL